MANVRKIKIVSLLLTKVSYCDIIESSQFERIHMNACLPATTHFSDTTRTRPLGIGGTDIGAILGLSPYKTPLELWSELVSSDPQKSRDLLHLRYGQHNESFVAREYERAT